MITKISNDKVKRLTEAELTELGIVLSAYRSLRGNKHSHIAYVSMPINSGKLYFETLNQAKVQTEIELEKELGPEALYELIIKPNIAAGVAFADKLGQEKELIFIAPSVFEAHRWQWSQEAYMSLWYSVIGELAGAHYVQDDWAYSLGSLREVFFSSLMKFGMIQPYSKQWAVEAFGLQNFFAGLTPQEEFAEYMRMQKIKLYESNGQELHLDKAIHLCAQALTNLKKWGFPCQEMINISYKLMQIPVLSLDESLLTNIYFEARKQLQALALPRATIVY